MVSWRGVAKKRRKQVPAEAVGQMFSRCCDDATIVARRQPLFRLIRSSRPFSRSKVEAFEKQSLNLQLLGESLSSFFKRQLSSAGTCKQPTRDGSPTDTRIEHADSC